ncbi:MAG: hypothetical protein Q8J70_03865, partial [Thiobacillus sp.]|nr:hypothetical protein [Thiobacillus sp.]
MNDALAVRSTRFSLFTRIMGTVFALVLMMYFVTLAVLGLPLKERAQQHLDVRAESEMSTIMTAIQDHVLLRDYPAIEQAFATRTARFQISGVRFSTPHITLESRTSIQPQH